MDNDSLLSTKLGSFWTFSKLALGILLALMLTVFAIQNADTTRIAFLVWENDISLALVVLVAGVSGVIFGVSFRSWQCWRASRKSAVSSQQESQ